ncbi:hypothetical protein EVAR_25949_1 [Eumeta japonica]|uniref:Uncharacterized protein n=1 Tax=Eumeta variegata TaxID=151549 RepID=A0A4C1V235_EUMVA|nr:hypothetical protein EVAR_25949_1 [Eumeta japonica]
MRPKQGQFQDYVYVTPVKRPLLPAAALNFFHVAKGLAFRESFDPDSEQFETYFPVPFSFAVKAKEKAESVFLDGRGHQGRMRARRVNTFTLTRVAWSCGVTGGAGPTGAAEGRGDRKGPRGLFSLPKRHTFEVETEGAQRRREVDVERFSRIDSSFSPGKFRSSGSTARTVGLLTGGEALRGRSGFFRDRALEKSKPDVLGGHDFFGERVAAKNHNGVAFSEKNEKKGRA